MRREIAVAARQPERVRRLLSVLADWLGVNMILKDFGIDSRNTAQLVFCEASDAAQFATPQPLDRLILVRAEGGANADSGLIFSNSPRLPGCFAVRQSKVAQRLHCRRQLEVRFSPDPVNQRFGLRLSMALVARSSVPNRCGND